jgi:hypothetical protein
MTKVAGKSETQKVVENQKKLEDELMRDEDILFGDKSQSTNMDAQNTQSKLVG